MEGPRQWEKIDLRVPAGMRDKIKIEAARNRRSMNMEIITHLERALESTAETN